MAAIIVRQQRISRIAASGITTLRVVVDRSLASAGGPGAGTVVTVPVTVETASILLPAITLYETATAPDVVTQNAVYSAQLLNLNGEVVSEVPGFGAFVIRIPAAQTTWNELRENNDFQALIQSAVTNRLGLDTTPTIGQSVITIIGGASQAGLDTINLFFGSSANPPGIRHNVATAQMEFSHDGLVWAAMGGGGGGGTVTSVGLSLPAIFSVSGSPVTTTGTLSGTLVNQSANTIFAGPTSGGAAAPAFRALVATDYPTMIGDSGAGGVKGAVPAPAAGDAAANKFLKADGTWTAVASAPVTSVFGRTGAVVAASGDYSFSQISGSVADGQLSANVTLLGNTTTGTGAIVCTTSPAIVTPTIASFVNATHNHENAAGGGQLNATNIFNAGTVPVARLPLLVGDSGAGGVAGLAPAPAAGDAAANKFLKANGTWATAGVLPAVNTQTGTSYVFAAGDLGKLVTFSNASPVAATLPQATGSFGSGWFVYVENLGAGTITITPTVSTIDGAATLTLLTNQGAMIVSDGANYSTQRGGAGLQAVNNMSDTWTSSGVTYTAILMNVNNIASAAASKLIDLQVGGTSLFKVQKDGKTGINAGASAPVRMLSVGHTATIGTATGGCDLVPTLYLWQNNSNITSYNSGNLYYGLVINSVNSTTPSLALGTYNGNFGVIAHHQNNTHLKFGYENGSLTETFRMTGDGRFSVMSAATANPGTSELVSLGAASLYVKGSKFVIAYNNGGTITYITIPLDGATATWTQSTTAP